MTEATRARVLRECFAHADREQRGRRTDGYRTLCLAHFLFAHAPLKGFLDFQALKCGVAATLGVRASKVCIVST